jgi:hypothetical protein
LEQKICNNPSNKLCQSCTSTNNCNFGDVRDDESCIVCNSATDSKCSQNPSSLQSEHCLISSDGECFEKIQNGATIRGCKGNLTLADLNSCRNTTAVSQCKITRGQGTNTEIIPLNRRRCYHCDSRVDPSCGDPDIKNKNSNLSLPCKRFAEPESCIKIKIDDASKFLYPFNFCL